MLNACKAGDLSTCQSGCKGINAWLSSEQRLEMCDRACNGGGPILYCTEAGYTAEGMRNGPSAAPYFEKACKGGGLHACARLRRIAMKDPQATTMSEADLDGPVQAACEAGKSDLCRELGLNHLAGWDAHRRVDKAALMHALGVLQRACTMTPVDESACYAVTCLTGQGNKVTGTPPTGPAAEYCRTAGLKDSYASAATR